MDDLTMSGGGWIKLWRKTLDSAVWQLPMLDFSVWVWLLMSVNWEPKKTLMLQQEVEIGPGEIITSYAHIAEGVACGGGRRGCKRVVPSARQIRTATQHLLELNCVETITDPGQGRYQPWLHLKVLHWEDYQGNDTGVVDTISDRLVSGSRQAGVRLVSGTKEGKKERSIHTTRVALEVLNNTPGYAFDSNRALDFIEEMMIEFPHIDVTEEIKSWRNWLRDKPLTKDSRPHAQIRNWLKRAKPSLLTSVDSEADKELDVWCAMNNK